MVEVSNVLEHLKSNRNQYLQKTKPFLIGLIFECKFHIAYTQGMLRGFIIVWYAKSKNLVPSVKAFRMCNRVVISVLKSAILGSVVIVTCSNLRCFKGICHEIRKRKVRFVLSHTHIPTNVPTRYLNNSVFSECSWTLVMQCTYILCKLRFIRVQKPCIAWCIVCSYRINKCTVLYKRKTYLL